MIKELMRKLKGAQTAKHWEEAIGELEASIQSTTANIGLLRSARNSALFEQQTEEEVAMLQQRIRQNEDELEMLKGNLELARSRHKEALLSEDRAEVDQLIRDAQPDLRKHAEMCAGYVETLQKMARSFIELERVQRSLFEVNDKLVSRGYPGDKLPFRQLQTGQAINQLNAVMITLTGQGNPDLGRHLRGEG